MAIAGEKTAIVACEIFFREICHFAASCGNVIDAVFLPKGLHDKGGGAMRESIQAEVDRCEGKGYRHIALGYALCNNGIAGVEARSVPLVVPKAHDCITLFLGSKERYKEYFFRNTGTYFHTTGWLERGTPGEGFFDSQLGPKQEMKELIEKYGEENAKYLAEILDPLKNYRKVAYISLPIPGLPDYRAASRAAAEEQGWEWEEVGGDPSLLERLVCGPHDSGDFLVAAPGEKIAPTGDDRILAVERYKA